MGDSLMPATLIDWMELRSWSQHHVEWHAVRQWDINDEATQQWMLSKGWQRAARQEGEAGNGFDFLIMHRAMLELLREAFPQYVILFAGWDTPPVAPSDPQDPLPNGSKTPFDSKYMQAIRRIESPPGTFANEDAWGLYVQTLLQPLPGDPFHRSNDRSSGIHNYIHNRFSDRSSSVDMGNPGVNLGNLRFWKLHGWIDSRWDAFRRAKGLSDEDATYQQALHEHKSNLGGHGSRSHIANAAMRHIRGNAPVTFSVVPSTLMHPFERSFTREFARLAHQVTTLPSLDDLEELLQLAIMVEHFTIPLYLCAWWSIKMPQGLHEYKEVSEILKKIVLQEMLHLGIVSNLIVAIGRHPKIIDSVPHYPSHIPGILTKEPIQLERISKLQVGVFQKIEQPEFPPVLIHSLGGPPVSRFKTIGELYTTIAELFQTLADTGSLPTLTLSGQLSRDFDLGGPENIGKLEHYGDLSAVKKAIELIKQQGEGTSTSGSAPGPSGTIAHYYQFGQILDENKYVLQLDGSLKKDLSHPIRFPSEQDIWAMAPIPENGYPGTSDEFDHVYSDMVRLLEKSWSTGDQSSLDQAVDAMRNLYSPAVALMAKERKPEPGNYGPSFRFLPPAPTPVPTPTPQPHFQRIQQILDQAVNGETIGAHGAFWRTLDRDDFVMKSVYGVPLIVKNGVGQFDPDLSNLVLALEGKPPFDGSSFPQMPFGYSPVPQTQIDEIRSWIGAGCPA